MEHLDGERGRKGSAQGGRASRRLSVSAMRGPPAVRSCQRLSGLKEFPMPTITLPDGKTKSFDRPVTGLEVAQSIGPGLAKAALAIKIDGETRDLSTVIDRDAKVALITNAKPGQ